MNWARQLVALLTIGLSDLTQRKGPALTIVIGVACAVGVLVAMLAMGTGARRQEMGNVRPDRAVLIPLGAQGFFGSIPREEATAVEDLPDIRKGAGAKPIVVLESVVQVDGRARGNGARTFFPLMGVTSNVTEYRPEIRFTAGRMFRSGLHELVASNTCARLFSGFDLGDRRAIQGSDWKIVGHFDQGNSRTCTVYADVNALMSTLDRNTYSRIEVMLQSPADLDAFRSALAADPALHLQAIPERQVVQATYKPLNSILDFASYFVGTIMAIGGTLGTINSLYAIVDTRRRELATLRALGFRPGPIVISTLCESVLLAIPGALIGAAVAWALFNGLSASPFGYGFDLVVNPAVAATGVAWALAMGVLGGVLPAVRSARISVSAALRAT